MPWDDALKEYGVARELSRVLAGHPATGSDYGSVVPQSSPEDRVETYAPGVAELVP